MSHYQIVIIGAGPGGYVAAIKAAQEGLKVAVVERREVGGTCLNRGCIPTKAILHTTELYNKVKDAGEFGLEIEGVKVNYDGIRNHKTEVCTRLRTGVEQLLAANGVDLIAGDATVFGTDRIEVALNDGTSTTLQCDDLIIAAGSNPATPPIQGIELENVYNSDSLLENLPELESITIIGGGVIGVEFAGVYSSLGTKVNIIETSARVLSALDKEFSQTLAMSLKKTGASIIPNSYVSKIEKTAEGELKVTYTCKDEEKSVTSQAVLVSTGRRPALENLFGEGFAPKLERGCIDVNEKLETSIAHVYAIGDACNATLQLAHAASALGIIAVENILGQTPSIKIEHIPSCVYTNPEIATVGLSPDAAKDSGIDVKVGKFAMSGNGKTIIANKSRSFVKIVADENDKVIGAHFMCGRATDMIGEAALAISNNLHLQNMAHVVRAHPTFSEGIGEAVDQLLGGAIHAMPVKK